MIGAWHPIGQKITGKTPKDVSKFLVWVPHGKAGFAEIAWWGAHDGDGGVAEERIDGAWRYAQSSPGEPIDSMNEAEPTHWMLLPGEPGGASVVN